MRPCVTAREMQQRKRGVFRQPWYIDKHDERPIDKPLRKPLPALAEKRRQNRDGDRHPPSRARLACEEPAQIQVVTRTDRREVERARCAEAGAFEHFEKVDDEPARITRLRAGQPVLPDLDAVIVERLTIDQGATAARLKQRYIAVRGR